MKIWLIGAERDGIEILQQLYKNPTIEVIISSPVDNPRAVEEGVVAQVDYVEYVTALNINQLAQRIRPDLIIVDPGAGERKFGRVSGGMALSEGLHNEMAATSTYPCIIL